MKALLIDGLRNENIIKLRKNINLLLLKINKPHLQPKEPFRPFL